MNFFEKLFQHGIKYAHPETKLRIADYKLPWVLRKYYCLVHPIYGFKTEFEHDIDKFMNCRLDRFNVDFMNNKLIALYKSAMADIEEQYIYRKKHALAIKTNRNTYISDMEGRIRQLENQNILLEQQLKEDGIEI